MRKRTIKYGLDKIFWYIIYALPIICYLIFLSTGNYETIPSLLTAISSFGLDIATNSDLYLSLSGIFGVNGVVPLFASADIIFVLTWFVGTYLVHLMVDFLLFIPKIAMKWLDKLYGGEE